MTIGRIENDHGFTLVETIAAFTICTMLILAGSYSLSLFLDLFARGRIEARNDLERFSRTILLKQAVEGAYDYYVKASKQSETYVPYFRTDGTGFSFATASPLWGTGETCLARVEFVRDGEFFALKYKETGLEDKYLVYGDEPIEYNHAYTIHGGIRAYDIAYYGAKDASRAGLLPEPPELAEFLPPPLYEWYPDYNADRRSIVPQKVRIVLTLANDEKKRLIFQLRTMDLARPQLFNLEAVEE